MNDRFCVDANIFITAWNTDYPKHTFPSLWDELAKHKSQIILIKPIYDEIDPISSNDKNKSSSEKKEKYPLRTWLNENDFAETPINDEAEKLSLELEQKYEIDNTSTGANQVDIKLIAYAKLENKPVVTFEKMQTSKPGSKISYKIPLICKEEKVDCLTFVEMLNKLGIKI